MEVVSCSVLREPWLLGTLAFSTSASKLFFSVYLCLQLTKLWDKICTLVLLTSARPAACPATYAPSLTIRSCCLCFDRCCHIFVFDLKALSACARYSLQILSRFVFLLFLPLRPSGAAGKPLSLSLPSVGFASTSWASSSLGRLCFSTSFCSLYSSHPDTYDMPEVLNLLLDCQCCSRKIENSLASSTSIGISSLLRLLHLGICRLRPLLGQLRFAALLLTLLAASR